MTRDIVDVAPGDLIGYRQDYGYNDRRTFIYLGSTSRFQPLYRMQDKFKYAPQTLIHYLWSNVDERLVDLPTRYMAEFTIISRVP